MLTREIASPRLLDKKEFREIAIFRPASAGEFLYAVPAVRALRRRCPRARLTWIGLKETRELALRFSHYLDGFLEFPGFPGLGDRPAGVEQLPEFFQAAQQARFDLAIQMCGNSPLANPLVACLGAATTAGYRSPGSYCPSESNHLDYPLHESEVRRHLRLADFLGAPADGEQLEFPVVPADEQDLHRNLGSTRLKPGQYACIHPGADAASARWEPEAFAVVADALSEAGLRVVLVGGPQERELGDQVRAHMHSKPVNLAGRLGLGALAALFRDARLFVGNDTGAASLAQALRVPSILVFKRPEPSRYPLDRQLHRVVCRLGGPTPAKVLEETVDLLRKLSGSAVQQSLWVGGAT